MQLKKYKSVRSQLTVATCGLLAVAPVAAESQPPVDVSVSSMIYSEEGRVMVNEDVLEVTLDLGDEESITGRYIFDTMSGASHNGLPKLNTAQTVTSPSGATVTTTDEPTFAFQDTRHSVSVDWVKPITRLLKSTNSAAISSEYDYFSVGASSSWAYDINDRLTTLTAGASANYDSISPVGGTPHGLGSEGSKKDLGDQNKTEIDALVGITQIIDRYTLFQANYSIGFANGYLTDPYKLVGYLDGTLTPVSGNAYIYEKRPGSRLKNAIYFQIVRDFNDDVLRAGYRYFFDDWGVQSFTGELKYSFSLPKDGELQLRYRIYQQTAASFYHYYLIATDHADANPLDVVSDLSELDYASADHRLANISSQTVGVKYSQRFIYKESKLDIRLDRMTQVDVNKRFDELKAWIAQIAFRFVF